MAARIYGVIAWSTTVAAITEFYLAGLGVFRFRANDRFEPHELLGSALQILAIALVLFAVLSRQAWRVVAMTVALLVLAWLQGPWIAATNQAWVKAIHVLGGVGIFGLSAAVAWLSLRQPFPARRPARRSGVESDEVTIGTQTLRPS